MTFGFASLNAWNAWPSQRCPRANGPEDGSREEQPLRRGAQGTGPCDFVYLREYEKAEISAERRLSSRKNIN